MVMFIGTAYISLRKRVICFMSKHSYYSLSASSSSSCAWTELSECGVACVCVSIRAHGRSDVCQLVHENTWNAHRAPSTSKRKCTISKVHLFCARSHSLRLVFSSFLLLVVGFYRSGQQQQQLLLPPHTHTHCPMAMLSNSKLPSTSEWADSIYILFSRSSILHSICLRIGEQMLASACVRSVCSADGSILCREQFCGVPAVPAYTFKWTEFRMCRVYFRVVLSPLDFLLCSSRSLVSISISFSRVFRFIFPVCDRISDIFLVRAWFHISVERSYDHIRASFFSSSSFVWWLFWYFVGHSLDAAAAACYLWNELHFFFHWSPHPPASRKKQRAQTF